MELICGGILDGSFHLCPGDVNEGFVECVIEGGHATDVFRIFFIGLFNFGVDRLIGQNLFAALPRYVDKNIPIFNSELIISVVFQLSAHLIGIRAGVA